MTDWKKIFKDTGNTTLIPIVEGLLAERERSQSKFDAMFIRSFAKRQEIKHKKELKEAIDDCWENMNKYWDEGNDEDKSKLYKKYNLV